jgi:hypothetical protein
VENACARWAYTVLSFGPLIDLIIRRTSHSWDILVLLVVSGFVAMGYQAYNRTLPWRQLLLTWLAIIPFQVLLGYLAIAYALRQLLIL